MENHPIPQDITGFQFKLIGNLTVRQFSYLAAGGILAAIFIFILPIPFIVGLFFGLIFLGVGAAFAFVPIDGRPMDVMVGNFFKALFTPTKYIYQKTGGDLSRPSTLPQVPSQLPASPSGQVTTTTLNSSVPIPQPTANPLPPLNLDQNEPAVRTPQTNEEPSNQNEKETELEKMLAQIQSQKEELEKQLTNLKSQLDDQKNQPLPASEAPSLAPVFEANNTTSVQNQLETPEIPSPTSVPTVSSETTDAPVVPPTPNTPPTPEPVLSTVETLNPQPNQSIPQAQTIAAAQPQAAPQQQPNNVPPTPPQPPLPSADPAPAAPPSQPAQALPPAGLPIPEAPNLITGIVRDPRGNPLQNILVEVKDQDGNPVRAFKTNGLGRFASATSLANGKYLIIFEDPKGANRFDPAQIDAIGNPLIPLEIVSVDAREELRRELFN